MAATMLYALHSQGVTLGEASVRICASAAAETQTKNGISNVLR